MSVLNWLKRPKPITNLRVPAPPPFVNPFVTGDSVQLKGPQNPHKGMLKIGNKYLVKLVARDAILIAAENGTLCFFDAREFIQAPIDPLASGAEEYDEILKAQELMQ